MQSSRLAEKANVSSADLRRATWTRSLGGILEYCGFVLYGLASTIILGPLFFPNQELGMVLIVSLGTYFLGFTVRPVGGIIFDSLGDRLGRKFVLLATVLLTGIASTLIGVLPICGTVRIWAPIMLVALRLLQGLDTRAEQTGTVVLMTEYAPDGKRSYYATLPFLEIQIGTFMASAVYFILLHSVTNPVGIWWWRLPFPSSMVIIAVAIYIRPHLRESPSFAELEACQQVTELPLRSLLKISRRNAFVEIGLRLAENGGSSIYQASAVSYVVGVVGLDKSAGTLCLMSAVVVSAIMVSIAGWLTDHFDRVLIYRSLAIFQLLITFPVWQSLSHGNVPVAIVSLSLALGIGAWDMFGAQGVFLLELFGVRHRYIGVALARKVSTVIAGGITPLADSVIISWVIHTNDPSDVVAWVLIVIYLSLLTVGTIIAAFFAPEIRDRDFDGPADAETISVSQHNQTTGTSHDA